MSDAGGLPSGKFVAAPGKPPTSSTGDGHLPKPSLDKNASQGASAFVTAPNGQASPAFSCQVGRQYIRVEPSYSFTTPYNVGHSGPASPERGERMRPSRKRIVAKHRLIRIRTINRPHTPSGKMFPYRMALFNLHVDYRRRTVAYLNQGLDSSSQTARNTVFSSLP